VQTGLWLVENVMQQALLTPSASIPPEQGATAKLLVDTVGQPSMHDTVYLD
jgi:hypothetical protein